ncbi:MAG: hypothetical protein ACOYZ8_06570 [Chloroflexota bacterium]
MPIQLTLGFTPKPCALPALRHDPDWLDVSGVARGVGFIFAVEISPALCDALEPISTEQDGDYDQRLFDALWLARFQLSLDQRESANFTFTFPRRHWRTGEITEVSLRLRCEAKDKTAFLGLVEDF